MSTMLPARLALANGRIFNGLAPAWQFAQATPVYNGELVFNTGMTGYEETLTDPSYLGQLLNFTYPILGNYGVSAGSNWESSTIQVAGVICETVFNDAQHHAATGNFLAWLATNRTPLICGIDSRELTKEIRSQGSLSAAIVCQDNLPELSLPAINYLPSRVATSVFGNGKHKVILVDCGAKHNILRCLLKFDVTVKQVAYDYDYSQEDYAGVVLSNGPGDPQAYTATIAILQQALVRGKPTFGICLGSQLLALAIGATTYKLKFGHRGQNQPCIALDSGLCYLTAQNHGYAVTEDSLPAQWQVSFRHLNDNTIAGIKHNSLPFSAVQFHPEASAGPHDTFYLFTDFMQQVANN